MTQQARTIAWLWLAACLTAASLPTSAAEAPPAPTVVTVVDLQKEDAPTRLALVCLQGIVNRGAERPTLFCLHGPQDAIWFDQLYAHAGFKAEAKSPAEAMERFADRVKGRILYDPAQPETVNLATALAGLEDALPATEPAAEGGPKTIEDLRGRFRTRAEAAQWAVEKLLPRCSKEKMALLNADQVGLRDYLVAEKILPVGLDPKVAEEEKALRSLLDRFPVGATLHWGGAPGSPAETRALFARDPGTAIPALARAGGKRLVPGADVANLSFHSRVPASAPLRQARRQVQYTPVKHVAFLFTGDGRLDFAFGRMRELWDDGARGLIPLGWELHPALAELAPALVGFYYTDARWGGSDQFVMAPSGAGYLPPTDANAWADFRAATSKAARALDLPIVSLIDLTAPDAEKPWPAYFADPGVRGILSLGSNTLYGREGYRPFTGEAVRVTDVEATAQAILEAGTNRKMKFILVVADGARVTPSTVAQVAARLGPGYTVVGLHQFMDLVAEREAIETLELRLTTLAKLVGVTFGPAKPGPEDSITIKATIGGEVADARVLYSMSGSPDFAEPLVPEGDDVYRAVIPPLLRGGELKFRVRIADALLRTTFSDDSKLTLTAADSDKDGLSDIQERIFGLDPTQKDADGDGLLDGNDPAPISPFPRPAGYSGPIITGVLCSPRTPPAAGKAGTLQATLFDPAGVKDAAVRFAVDGKDAGGGPMKELRSSQRFERALPALQAGQKLTATLTAATLEGKTSQVEVSFPVTLGVRITRPMEGARAQKDMLIRVDAAGKPAYVRLLVNGYEVVKLPNAPYQHAWDPFGYHEGTHEIVAEAYDAENHVVDFDTVHVRVLGPKR